MTIKLEPNKIINILNQGTQDLDKNTVSGLQLARAEALQKQARQAHTLQLAGHRWAGLLVPHTLQQWAIATLLLLAIASATGLWWQHNHHQRLMEVDMRILTDELPIEIFID